MSEPNDDLSAAIVAGDAPGVEAALAAGADANALATVKPRLLLRDDVPMLAAAAHGGDVAIVAALLEAGANPDARVVEWRCYPFSDDDVPFEEESALCLAGEAGNLAVVRLLLASGANPTLGHSTSFAARSGDLAVVQAVVAAGGNIHESDHDIHSPLYRAARAGRIDLVTWLFEQGARFTRDIDLQDAIEGAGSEAVSAWLRSHPVEALLR